MLLQKFYGSLCLILGQKACFNQRISSSQIKIRNPFPLKWVWCDCFEPRVCFAPYHLRNLNIWFSFIFVESWGGNMRLSLFVFLCFGYFYMKIWGLRIGLEALVMFLMLCRSLLYKKNPLKVKATMTTFRRNLLVRLGQSFVYVLSPFFFFFPSFIFFGNRNMLQLEPLGSELAYQTGGVRHGPT